MHDERFFPRMLARPWGEWNWCHVVKDCFEELRVIWEEGRKQLVGGDESFWILPQPYPCLYILSSNPMAFEIHIPKIFGLCMCDHYAQKPTVIFESLNHFSNLDTFIIDPSNNCFSAAFANLLSCRLLYLYACCITYIHLGEEFGTMFCHRDLHHKKKNTII